MFLRWSGTKYWKILYFCFVKIIFVEGDRASLTDIMCKDSTCVVAIVTEPHPSIALKRTFGGAKFLLEYWTEEGENRFKLKLIGPTLR